VENNTNKFKNSRYFVAEGSALYHEFLQLEFSNENLEFWQAVEDYKNSKPKDMAAKAQQIYKDFLTVNQSSKKQQVHQKSTLFWGYSLIWVDCSSYYIRCRSIWTRRRDPSRWPTSSATILTSTPSIGPRGGSST
jgi:hypothetical protein